MVDRWDADIGMHAAMAAISLAKGPCVESIVLLAHKMRLAAFQHWDEDDINNLMDAGVCAALMAKGVRKYPEMLASPRVVDALQVNAGQLNLVRDGLREFDARSPSDIMEIDGLIATIEKMDIESVTKPCNPAKLLGVRM